MSSSTELKAQGNALFVARNFEAAGKKYTEAIQVGDEAADPKGLAVVYANRAACRLSLKRYMDSRDDAKKATELDPTYAKAWARLAAANDALGKYPESQEHWKRALDALPQSNLKLAEQTQKSQYQAGLEAATAGVNKMKNTSIVGEQVIIIRGGGRMPWDLAAAMLPSLRVQGPAKLTSSAWVIHGAYEEFMAGINKMKQLSVDPTTNEMRGMIGAIVDLTNGIMRDERVMHIADEDFFSCYNKQMTVEMSVYRPWPEAGPEVIIREALERQRAEGWDSVRGSISLTIRAWIMRGVMEGGLRQRHDVALEFYKRSLETLRGLRSEWLLEPKENRGVVFENTFMFGIQNLYIEAIMQCYALQRSPELLEELLEECDLLISEVDDALRQPRSQEPVDPGFVSSFYIYPRATAFANKGFYYNHQARLNPNDSKELFRKAAVQYLKAADCFPQDDEKHAWFLNIAVGNMLKSCLFPLRETLDVMKRIRVAVPKAKEIWERSSLSAAGLWDILRGVARQEENLRSMLEQGKFTLNTCVGGTGGDREVHVPWSATE
ncbi:hypothetical protein B0H11DRAFT_2040437 [Mycena galericulata]|nr:hypothetical protein B0H11DRAFT_2040437 [Mycena galericulata]